MLLLPCLEVTFKKCEFCETKNKFMQNFIGISSDAQIAFIKKRSTTQFLNTVHNSEAIHRILKNSISLTN